MLSSRSLEAELHQSGGESKPERAEAMFKSVPGAPLAI